MKKVYVIMICINRHWEPWGTTAYTDYKRALSDMGELIEKCENQFDIWEFRVEE